MRINIYGGPGIGKSTAATWLFSELKQKSYNIELVIEYIKAWAWEQRVPASYDQVYIFAKQLRSEDLLLRRGIHIITDSPLPMQLAYIARQGCGFYDELYSLCKKYEEEHPALHILLKRSVPFQTFGRYETLSQAEQLDKNILETLLRYGKPFTTYNLSQPEEKAQLLSCVIAALDADKNTC